MCVLIGTIGIYRNLTSPPSIGDFIKSRNFKRAYDVWDNFNNALDAVVNAEKLNIWDILTLKYEQKNSAELLPQSNYMVETKNKTDSCTACGNPNADSAHYNGVVRKVNETLKSKE